MMAGSKPLMSLFAVLCVPASLTACAGKGLRIETESVTTRGAFADDFHPTLPRIPNREVRLAESAGAPSDKDTTAMFAQAIEELHKGGGGRLVVPAGVWTTGPIHLKSGVELHLEEGAEIRFSTRYEDYLPVVLQQRGGVRCYNYSPLIYARDCEDIAVTGQGILNGQAEAWWPWKNKQPGMQRLLEMGWSRTPVEERVFGREKDGVRPDFIQFINCRRVLLEGITVKDGPSWNIHPVWCEDLVIRGVSVAAHGPNNDGIDPDGCCRVLIEYCHLDVGDDAICLKSGRDQEGWDAARPCEEVLIRHCQVLAGCGALVIGSEMSAGVRNVYAHDITAYGTDRGIRLKTRRGRGGIVEDIRIENVRMRKIKKEAIMINMQYGDRTLGEETVSQHPSDETTPTLRNITIRNVSCDGARQGVRIIGLPENPITGLNLEAIHVDAWKPNSMQHVEGVWAPALFP
ncbi:MAG: glycoside hydrolase family 28 protein [Candidatus Hydrogenedentes bacterium]|nr:glycoside hydrolase family 28 protein [Candidatus Hydrogenedentota bacterium]